MGTNGSEATPSSFSSMTNFLRQTGGVAILGGGLATELERRGAISKILSGAPNVFSLLLTSFAPCTLITLKLATIQGFEAKGFSRDEREGILRKSIEIACEARDAYYERCDSNSSSKGIDGKIFKKRPTLVAASVGSHSAYLADGLEYSGIYGDAISLEILKDFHRRQIQVLTESGADLIAFEAIPNMLEAQAYAEVLGEIKVQFPAWFSFVLTDAVNVVSGDSIMDCAATADSCEKIVERNKEAGDEDIISYINNWCEAGVSIIGGCCRTTATTVRSIYNILHQILGLDLLLSNLLLEEIKKLEVAWESNLLDLEV